MALILLRHTRPVGADGTCYGTTDLPPGPDLANEVRRLTAQLPPVTRILTSPLTRCARLAEALSAARHLPLTTDPRLRELHFGTWENTPWDRVPRTELDAWAADLHHARPHGGETVAEMAARVTAALTDAETLPDDTLIVTHMGPIRAALARAGTPGAWEARIAFGHWTALPP
jgi:alpha-ribazole phosphatase